MLDVWSLVGGAKQENGKGVSKVVRQAGERTLKIASSACGPIWFLLVWFLQPQLKPVDLYPRLSFPGGCIYLLVPHCRRLSCNTNGPSFFRQVVDKVRGIMGDFCRSNCSAVPKKTSCAYRQIKLALPILPPFSSSGGVPQVSLKHPLAFHTSWYYFLFVPLLFKLDADPAALDMCVLNSSSFFLRVSLETG